MCMGILEGQGSEEGTEKIFKEIMAKTFLNLLKNYVTYLGNSTNSKWDECKRSTNTTYTKMLKVQKEEILKSARKMTHDLQVNATKINN